jgi:hypothetical protein
VPRSKKKKKPQQIVATLDCETDPFAYGASIAPFVWGLYFSGEFRHFQTIEEVLAFIGARDFLVFAHNGGKFDFLWLLEHLQPESSLLYINNRLAKFTIGTIEFRDSVCILPCKLAEYAKGEVDYSRFTKDKRDEYMPVILDYLKSDCVYLYEMVTHFRETYGDSLTLAGTAFKVWQEMYDVTPPRSSAGYFADMSAYYYGGRVQAFRKGLIAGPISMVDICSAYPYAMLHPHTSSLAYITSTPSDDAAVNCAAFYTVECEGRGLLPQREKTGGICFPEGRGVYTVTGWEVAAWRDITGMTPRVIKCVEPCAVDDFGRYVRRFYELKKLSKKGSPDYIEAKLLMNSLYGRFAINPDNFLEFQCIPSNLVQAYIAECAELGVVADVVGTHKGLAIVSTPLDEDKKRFCNVATGASITGFVRAYLARAMHAIRLAGGDVLYCDTDSIAFTGGADHGLPIGNELGQWEYEAGAFGAFDRGAIAGRKLYAFHKAGKTDDESGWKTAHKGVQLSAAKIVEVAMGVEVEYKREAPSFNMLTGETKYIKRRVKMT